MAESIPPHDALTPGEAQALSALADGEASAQDTDLALQAWRRTAQARGLWQSHHVVGDVLRSPELAISRSSDAEFLGRLRESLAQEPVVLAPGALPLPGVQVPAVAAARPASRRWAGASAVAAGFVLLVGGVVNHLGVPEAPGQGASVATLGVAGTVSGPTASALRVSLGDDIQRDAQASPASFRHQARARFTEPEPLAAEMIMIRDPQLDQALARHGAELAQVQANCVR